MNWGPLVWFDQDNSGAAAGAAPPSDSAAPGSEGASAPASSGPPNEGASPPEGAEATPSSSHDPFDGMDSADFYDSIDLGPAGTGDEPGPAPQGRVAGVEGVPQPPATAAAPAAPQAAPVAPPTAPAAPAENVPASARSQLDQAMEGFKGAANQTALADWASRELFKLSDEEAAALETNAGDLIPKLMGKVYTQAMQSAVNLIKNLVPEMVNSGITTQQARSARASEALSEFYQANPHLSADQHGSAVDRWARSFRAANPAASRADAIAFVGKAVSAEFGIWPGQNGSGAAAKRPPPFAPARQGGRAPAQAKGPHDPYAGMEDEYD